MRAGCPMGSNGGHEGPPRGTGARLLLATALCVALSASAHAATPLRTIVEDVPGSTAHRYGTRDNRRELDAHAEGREEPARRLPGRLPHGRRHAVHREGGDQPRSAELALRGEPGRGRARSRPSTASSGARRWSPTRPMPAARAPSGAWSLRHYATESALLSGAATQDRPPAAHAVELRRGDAEHLLGHEQPDDRGRRLPLLPGLPRRPAGKGHAARLRPGDVGPGRDAVHRREHPGRRRERRRDDR